MPLSSRRRRRGAVPAWVPLAVLACGAVWLSREIRARTADAGFERIEMARAAFTAAPPWEDPRWRDIAAFELARLGDIHPGDRPALDAAAARLAALPFVRRVAAPRVLWPAGVEFDLELRRPLACVRAGEHFYPVDQEGRVLSGGWSSPPWVDSGFLPVLVDHPHAPPFVPGDALDGLHLVDALDVAVSMWEHLSSDARARLGRIAIDARDGRTSDSERGGVVLLLEDQRAVLFGRPPGRIAPAIAEAAPHQPGDLAAARRWNHVATALERLASGRPDEDWSQIDVRFDTPAVAPRVAPGEAIETVGGAYATRKGTAEGASARPLGSGASASPAAGRASAAPAGRSGVR